MIKNIPGTSVTRKEYATGVMTLADGLCRSDAATDTCTSTFCGNGLDGVIVTVKLAAIPVIEIPESPL